MSHFSANDTMTRLPRAVWFFIVAALLLPAMAFGKYADYLALSKIPNADFGEWTQAGSVSTLLLNCIASANDNAASSKEAEAQQMPYQVKVDNASGGSGFFLYLDGDPANTDNRRLAITLFHRDVNDGGLFEVLGDGVYESDSHVGGFKNCATQGDNSELRIDIDGAELAGKVSGSYSGAFQLRAVGGASGAATDSDTFSISIDIQSTPAVMISGLDNLSLGTHAGLGDIHAEENFCVYSSSGTGSYTMTIHSSNQDGSGNFYLVNGGGLGQIAYALAFTDQGSGAGSTPVGNGSLGGFGDTSDPGCNGGNNASLSVLVAERDLQMAKSGTYNDSLVILVEPQ